MIQGVISRMGQNAFNAKTWAVTVMAAVFALGPENGAGAKRAVVVLVPLFLFWALDAYYLRQERLFRKLYEAAVLTKTPPYSMDARPHARQVSPTLRVAFSSGVWPVHVITVLAVGAKAVGKLGSFHL